MLLVMCAIAFVYMNMWILPPTLKVFFVWGFACVISLLSMSWCLNNETVCRQYFVNTQSRAQWVVEEVSYIRARYTGEHTPNQV